MANYPTSVSTNANLYIAVNGLQTTLAANINNSVTTIQLTSTTGFPTTGLVTIENNEVVSYTGISGPNLTGCTRGADGTTALSHNLGVTVGATIVAAHHNLLKDEVIAIETALGANLSNVFPATPTTGTGNVVLQTSPTITTPTINSPTLTSPALGTPASGVMTNVTGLPLTTGVTGVLPNANTTATSAATASAIVSRDANSNTKVNTLIENFSTTVTAAGTTVLTASTSPIQQFTGTTTQTVTLPDATTLAVGYQITVLNRSTGSITVNNNGGSLQKTVPTSTQYIFTCTNTGSANGTWDVSSDAGTGTVTSVSGTTNQITSTGGNTPVLALANPLTPPGVITGQDGSQSAPGYSFSADTNTGMFRAGADDLSLVTGGLSRVEVTNTQVSINSPFDVGTHKITSLSNGTAASDAAAFGQVQYLSAPAQTTDTSTTTTTSSTFQSTGLTASITPSSSSSRIKITVSGMASLAVAGPIAIISVFRGTTNLGGTIGFQAVRTPAAAVMEGVIGFAYIDSPATTSSTTYTVKIANNDNSTSVQWNREGITAILILEEIR